MGRLTTHVLDTALGKPAEGLKLHLSRVDGAGQGHPIKTVFTNADGRLDEPLLEGEVLEVGVYELLFDAGSYFKDRQLDLPHTPFLDEIPVRFGVSDPTAHYHVPLLLSPYSYATYRGS